MLILSRFHGQKVIITTPQDEKLEILVLKSGKRGISLGFNAPKEFNIVRSELLKENIKKNLDKE